MRHAPPVGWDVEGCAKRMRPSCQGVWRRFISANTRAPEVPLRIVAIQGATGATAPVRPQTHPWNTSKRATLANEGRFGHETTVGGHAAALERFARLVAHPRQIPATTGHTSRARILNRTESPLLPPREKLARRRGVRRCCPTVSDIGVGRGGSELGTMTNPSGFNSERYVVGVPFFDM